MKKRSQQNMFDTWSMSGSFNSIFFYTLGFEI